ncbi:hypothetical protein [Methanoplanus endosymbiosus]|uniref:Uncharacterized protein n=1 Tax=Methanoplanus endosymbiosus TaxID=33865 RepID=A0A9E7PLT3_9EURY|nr:hypothetical protein [Methanoplanus endosymbiosus]UUX92540.1 hypothetical protein L6E24_14595 [Methanoplanus endosymbiosus]
MWEKKRVLITVKAYPEHSRRHGDVVCTAGITDEGEFIRLYPINTRIYFGEGKIKKYDWIEVECKKATDEKLNRKESYRVREESIRIIDRSLSVYKRKAPWAERNKIILDKVSPSISYLQNAFKEGRTSLGLIKAKEILDFYTKEELMTPPEAKHYQGNLFDDSKIPVIDNIPHIFAYKFFCEGCFGPEPCNKNGKYHNIMCEDWEIFEAYRNFWKRCSNTEELWRMLYDKMFSFMKERDLYFFMGMHSLQPTWLIIGLYYPDLNSDILPKDNSFRTLDQWM